MGVYVSNLLHGCIKILPSLHIFVLKKKNLKQKSLLAIQNNIQTHMKGWKEHYLLRTLACCVLS